MNEKYLLSIAHALYSTRLHLLTLTEIVRAKIEADEEGIMELPRELHDEMKQQAFDYLIAMFPPESHAVLLAAKGDWMTQQ